MENSASCLNWAQHFLELNAQLEFKYRQLILAVTEAANRYPKKRQLLNKPRPSQSLFTFQRNGGDCCWPLEAKHSNPFI